MRTKTLLSSTVAALIAISVAGPSISQSVVTPRGEARSFQAFPPPGAPLSFADIVERVAPAVVSIEVRRQTTVRLPTIPGFPFDLFPQGQGQGQPQETRAAGSGFFISADGYLVTNNHVVADATEITVTLKDQRELKARVIGRDEPTDLAVLKVEERNLPYVSFANSAMPRVGDWVIAVGNPFGLGGTATAGIVSAYGRDIGSTFVDYIQIDAPINRGNSGGPTFDAFGRVIGVNTMIFSPSGGSVGIGFAIPAEVAERVTRDLIANGRIVRGYIGATIQTVTSEMAESLGLRDRRGALIAEVVAGGPAEQAGLQPGDVVLDVGGRDVENASQLTRQVAAARAGDTLRMRVVRAGAPRTIDVRTGVRPAESQLAGGDTGSGAGTLGLTMRPLDEAGRRANRLSPSIRGALVSAVDPGSDAGRKGVRRGDVIVRINDDPVSGPVDVASAVERARVAGRSAVLVFIHRDGRQMALPIRIAAAER